MNEKVLKNPELDEDMDQDFNSFLTLIIMKYSLMTFRLILMIFNASYFTGITWILFCDFMNLHT